MRFRWPRRTDTETLVAAAADQAAARALATYQAEQRQTREQIAELQRAVAEGTLADQHPLGTPERAMYPLYARDHPWTYRTPQAPYRKPESLVDTATLRRLADVYDILRAGISHLQREVASVPIEITPKDDSLDSPAEKARVAEAKAWFDFHGGVGGRCCRRRHFEYRVIEDLCVIGATALYFAPTRGGDVYEVIAIDAATIRPRVDGFGWPGPGEAWYEQWVEGIQVRGFTPEELCYDGIYPRTWTPYFAAPTEWVLEAAQVMLGYNAWNRMWLTDGTEPGKVFSLPDTWTPQMVMEYSQFFDLRNSGNMRERQKVQFVPSGASTSLNPTRRDQEFTEGQLWMMRRTLAILGVQPASIGFTGEQFKVTQEESMHATTEFGAGVLLQFRADLYNEILRRLGYDDLECRNVTGQEEDANTRATRLVSLVDGAILTPNEARAEDGREGMEGGDTLFVKSTLRPLEQALEPPEPPMAPGGAPGGAPPAAARAALALWERKALNRLRRGRQPACDFEHVGLPEAVAEEAREGLALCRGAEEVRALFADLLTAVAADLPPSYTQSSQAHERAQIAARWRARKEEESGD